MNPSREERNRVLFSDKILQDALSDVGIFATDYSTGETFPSAVWRERLARFSVSPDNSGILEFIHPDDRPRVAASLRDVFDGNAEAFHESYRVKGADKEWHWIFSTGRTVTHTDAGTPELYIGADFDITDLKEIEARLREVNRREIVRREQIETMRSIAAAIGSSLDLDTTVEKILRETSRIIPYEAATVQILHESHLEVIGGYGFQNIDEILKLRFPFPEAGSIATRAIQEKRPFLTNDMEVDFPAFVQPFPDKPILSWLGIPLIRYGDVIGLVAIDSCERGRYADHHIELAATIGDHIAIALENARLHERTYQLAMADSLTGAGSRHRFSIEGRLLFENAKRGRRPISGIMIDIDHFKDVNDNYGHDVGDTVLRRIAIACAGQLRTTDLFARYGGEEFVLLLPETPCDEAVAVTERILATIRKISYDDHDLVVTVSAGVVGDTPRRDDTIEQFVRRADEALYESKQTGRDRLTVWSASS